MANEWQMNGKTNLNINIEKIDLFRDLLVLTND